MNKELVRVILCAIICLSTVTERRIMAQTDSVQNIKTIKEVVVTGSREASELRLIPLSVSVIDRNIITEQARINVLPTLMEQVPGLMLTSRGTMGYGVSTGASGTLSLRGLSSSNGQMLVLIDGHPQYNGIYGHSISDSYQTLMAERIEVVRGPASMLYGSNAMGGVVNIVTRKLENDGVQLYGNFGLGSYGTVQNELSAQVRKGKLSATIATQYGQSDNHRENMGFEQYGGYTKIGYQFSNHWDLSADLNLTHFNASNPGTTAEPKTENTQSITRGTTFLILNNRYSIANGSVSIFDNFGFHEINDGYKTNGGTPQTDLFKSSDAVAGVSLYENFHFWNTGLITIGFDYQHIYGHAWYVDRITGATVTTPKRLMQSANERSNNLAGYINVRQTVSHWLTLDGGIRYDHHSVAGSEWIPQAGIVISPIDNGEIKLMAGKGFRNPTMKEMYMYGTANHDSLHAERMWNYEVAWTQSLGILRYGINFYYIKGDNMIATVGGKNINTGEFEDKGVETEITWTINSHWQITTNHSYLHMNNPVVASPVYKGYLGTQCHYGRWTVMAGLQPVADLYTEVGNNEKKESFALLNAMLSYRIANDVVLWVRGDNLLNQKYEINAGYPMPGATMMAGISLQK